MNETQERHSHRKTLKKSVAEKTKKATNFGMECTSKFLTNVFKNVLNSQCTL